MSDAIRPDLPAPGRFGPADVLRHPDMRRVVRRFVPPALAGLAAAILLPGDAPLPVLLGLLSGLFAWSFLEYVLHRWILHWEPVSARGRRIRRHLPGHRSHHNGPHDPDDVVTNRHGLAIPLALLGGGLMALAGLPHAFILATLAGAALGYVAYEYIHFGCHQLRMTSRLGRRLRQHHALHHHRDETVNFGVTNWFWDRVFGTHFRPR